MDRKGLRSRPGTLDGEPECREVNGKTHGRGKRAMKRVDNVKRRTKVVDGMVQGENRVAI